MKLDLEPKEVQYLADLAAAVPTGQTLNAGMSGLIPKIMEQANAQQPQAAATPALTVVQ
jgi:hypothetical protein